MKHVLILIVLAFSLMSCTGSCTGPTYTGARSNNWSEVECPEPYNMSHKCYISYEGYAGYAISFPK